MESSQGRGTDGREPLLTTPGSGLVVIDLDAPSALGGIPTAQPPSLKAGRDSRPMGRACAERDRRCRGLWIWIFATRRMLAPAGPDALLGNWRPFCPLPTKSTACAKVKNAPKMMDATVLAQKDPGVSLNDAIQRLSISQRPQAAVALFQHAVAFIPSSMPS